VPQQWTHFTRQGDKKSAQPMGRKRWMRSRVISRNRLKWSKSVPLSNFPSALLEAVTPVMNGERLAYYEHIISLSKKLAEQIC
jgi:hypothetical protein